jgi:hypothetical protein
MASAVMSSRVPDRRTRPIEFGFGAYFLE